MQRDEELLGLTEYEGRVYRALLAESPATAYRLGKVSGVPLSRVYEVADRLVQKGAATRADGEPARYVPAPPDALVAGARARLQRRLDDLAGDLAAIGAGGQGEGNAWLKGEESVLSQVERLAAEARDELLVGVSPLAMSRVEPALAACAPRVKVRALQLPAPSRDASTVILLADGETALMGRLGAAADALLTRHVVLTRLCAEYFRLHSIAQAAQDMMGARRPPLSPLDRPAGWLDWEEEKQRRLLLSAH